MSRESHVHGQIGPGLRSVNHKDGRILMFGDRIGDYGVLPDESSSLPTGQILRGREMVLLHPAPDLGAGPGLVHDLYLVPDERE